MSISSLLTFDLPETLPDSTKSSEKAKHAAEAPQVPPPKSSAFPVNDSASTTTDVEALTAGLQLCSMKHRNDTNTDRKPITAPVVEAASSIASRTGLPSATVKKDKGKGKDPKIYDLTFIEGDGGCCDPPAHYDEEEGEEEDEESPADRMAAATTLIQINHDAVPLSTPSTLRMSSFPTLSSSDDDEEGDETTPPLEHFTISCHLSNNNHQLSISARQGDAVFDLVRIRERKLRLLRDRLRLEGVQRGGRRRRGGEAGWCRVCEAVRQRRYVEGYMKLGCEGFRYEREDTVSVADENADDDDGDDGDEHHNPTSSDSSPETLRAEETREWTSVPYPPVLTTPSSPASFVAGGSKPFRLPLYLNESAVRSSLPVTPTPPSPPPADQRASDSYPVASNYIDLTGSTFSSPPPPPPLPTTLLLRRSARKPQARGKKAAVKPPSPLKQVQTVSSSSELHNDLPTTGTTTGPSNQTFGTKSNRTQIRRLHPGGEGYLMNDLRLQIMSIGARNVARRKGKKGK